MTQPKRFTLKRDVRAQRHDLRPDTRRMLREPKFKTRDGDPVVDTNDVERAIRATLSR